MHSFKSERSKQPNLSLAPARPERILLVDDDSKLLSSLSAYLFRGGAWDVWQAHSCGRARELWSEHREDIDVAIVDVRLKDGNGLTLLREFLHEKVTLLTIVISGVPVLDGSPGPFLLKPFTEEALLSYLASL